MGKRLLIVYFSGTGGTRLVADGFEGAMAERGCDVLKHSLDMQQFKHNRDSYTEIAQQIDRVLLIYAVHAMDAPEPVYEWIAAMPQSAGLPAAVISVSGGGEVWPNTSCRVAVIRALERKGYKVEYETMLVMPSNWITQGNDQVVMHVLNKLPVAVGRISDELLSGKTRRSRFRLSTMLLMPLSRMEKQQTAEFGNNLEADGSCSGCGWCEGNCPRENIQLEYGRPVFGDKCIICLRCIYGCPAKAIRAKKWSFVVVKTGFDLESVRRRMKGVELEPVDKCCKGLLWAGVKKYLKEWE
jgi:ferredoxin/flavodoxin